MFGMFCITCVVVAGVHFTADIIMTNLHNIQIEKTHQLTLQLEIEKEKK